MFAGGKIFAVFLPIAKVLSLKYLLCKVHDEISPMHCKRFRVNCVLCTMTVFPSKYLPCIAYIPYVHEKILKDGNLVNSH